MNNINLAFSALPQTSGDDLPKTIIGVAYSGAVVSMTGATGLTIVDLDSIVIAGNVLLLSEHKPGERMGHAVVRKEGYRLLMEAYVLDDPSTLALRRQLKAGMPLSLSIGVTGGVERPDGPVMVNGRMVKVDTVFRNARLREVSIVSVSADPMATVTAAFSGETLKAIVRLEKMLRDQVAGVETSA